MCLSQLIYYLWGWGYYSDVIANPHRFWSSEFPYFQVLDKNLVFHVTLCYRKRLYNIPVMSSHICKGLTRFKKTTKPNKTHHLQFSSLRQFNMLNFSKNVLILVLIQGIAIIRTVEGPKSCTGISCTLSMCLKFCSCYLLNWCLQFSLLTNVTYPCMS